ncbi:hypothetical protein K5X82_18700 [Halosquirtibacter xylanolyticus]|uniref:hypothetical protein n=1 Tax=Halosquirtibacter xylanolyticus TaxID=3374599 RepID=UPI003747952A|nr:hypothetical protein K5X82_18700 [Prolixibacteraceae bacterium]
MKSNFHEILFKCVPAFIQNVLISIKGLIQNKQRYKGVYERYLDIYSTRDNTDLEIKNIQTDELIAFVNYACKHSSFYRKLYSNIDIAELDIDNIDILPIVTKEDLRRNIKDVYTIKSGIRSFTGGTTGKSLEVIFTKEDFQKRMAYLDAFKIKLGCDPHNARKATFSGRHFSSIYFFDRNVFWRNNFAYNQRLYSTFELTPGNIPHYIKNLNEYKPNQINGFVSAIYILSKYINEKSIELKFVPDGIFTTSETLTEFHKIEIERAFNCRVYNQYASAEGAPFITECSEYSLHYNLDTGVIEMDPDSGEIIVTSFTSHGTPLIRYKIGDKIKMSGRKCNCGSCHPVVDSIEGRMVDYLQSPEGKVVSSSHMSDVIKGIPNSVINVQFVQDKTDHLNINLVVDKNEFKDYHKEKIINALIDRFGKEMKYTFGFFSSLPLEKSGKIPFIKSLL